MVSQGVLGTQLRRRADELVVAFDEHLGPATADDSRGRHRPGAVPPEYRSAARQVIPGQQRARLLAGERRPVGLDQRLAHAVR